MSFKQGDLVLVRYPFSNMGDYKIRPALVVSNNNFNLKNNIWVCPVTSKNSFNCIYVNDSMDEGKLNRNSYAKTNTVAVFEEEIILKKIGKITSSKINVIINKLISNF